MPKGKPTKGRRKEDVEKKRDERAVKRALQRERRLKGYLDENEEDFVAFSNQLAVQGFRIKDVPGDGNCLFRALADQLEGNMTRHMHHRRETVHFMVQHQDEFAPFVEDGVSFDRHVKNLAKEGTFGGNDSIVAFARNNKVDVVIHQHSAPRLHVKGSADNAVQVRHLNVSYHYGEHYSSLRRIGDNGDGPGYILVGGATAKTAAGTKQKPAKTCKRPTFESAAASGHDDVMQEMLEQLIQLTGCHDVVLLSEALQDCAFSVDDAVDYVLQLISVQETSLECATDHSLAAALSETAVNFEQLSLQSSNTGGAVPSNSGLYGEEHSCGDQSLAANMSDIACAMTQVDEDSFLASSLSATENHKGGQTDVAPASDQDVASCAAACADGVKDVAEEHVAIISLQTEKSQPPSVLPARHSPTPKQSLPTEKTREKPKVAAVPRQRKADKKRERKQRRAEERRLELQEQKQSSGIQRPSSSKEQQRVVDIDNVVEGVPQLLAI